MSDSINPDRLHTLGLPHSNGRKPEKKERKLSEAEIIKKNICDSCYDQGLHNLVNTPVEQVASAMREHTKQRLTAVKDRLDKLPKYGKEQGVMNADFVKLDDVLTAIEEELQ